MALADLSTPKIAITGDGITFEVGSLSAADLAELRRQHVVAAFDLLDAYKELLLHEGETQRMYGIASVFLEMSGAVSHAIALAAGEPDRVSEASRLPIGTQLQALTAIAQLSLNGTTLAALPPAIQDALAKLGALRPEEIN